MQVFAAPHKVSAPPPRCATDLTCGNYAFPKNITTVPQRRHDQMARRDACGLNKLHSDIHTTAVRHQPARGGVAEWLKAHAWNIQHFAFTIHRPPPAKSREFPTAEILENTVVSMT